MARLAGGQHGVVSRLQLAELGATADVIDGWIARGRLISVHRGVFAAGYRVLTAQGRRMAAVLACGPGSALCRRSAGALWELRHYSGKHEVATPRHRRGRANIVVVQLSLAPDEITTEDGIPVTTVARTLLDLASVLDHERLVQAVGAAEKRLLADSPSLPVLIERHRGARGLATLRTIVADSRLGIDVPASELEIEFATFVRRRGLPAPEVNAWLEVDGRWFELDCLWRTHGLAVELDSREHHADAGSFERDRARDTALLSIGVRTARVTARRLRVDPDGLERELRSALSGSGFGR